MKKNLSGLLFTAAIATALSAAPIAASAATFNFSNIIGADTVGDSLAEYLSFDVTASGNGTKFDFKFASNPTSFTGAFIRQVFIDGPDDNNALLGPNSGITTNVGNVGNVNFTGGTGTNNLPQSGELTTAFTTNYYFQRVSGDGNAKAVQEAESLGVLFADANFNSVITALNNSSLRVGYHVQGLAPGSDSYVNSIPTPPAKPVPVPGFVFGILAAGALGGKRLLSKKQAA